MSNDRMFSRLVLIITSVISMGLFTSCGDSERSKHRSDNTKKLPALVGPEEIISLYKNKCMQCHGNELQGVMGPKSNLQKIGSRLAKEKIARKIQNGGELMPAQAGRLTKMEIEKIAAWLASKN